MAKIPGKFNRDFTFRVLGFFAFVAWVLFCTTRHIPWRDEFQTFLVATRTKSLGEFWMATRYERTPPLLYSVQAVTWPLLKTFFSPRVFISMVSLSFTFLAAFVLFFRLRPPFIFALLTCFSVFLFREWGVISRCYVLGGALLWLSLDFRLRGKQKIATTLLAIASFAHLLFFVGCGLLFAEEGLLRLKAKVRRTKEIPVNDWVFYSMISAVFFVGLIHQRPPSDSAFQSAPAWMEFTRHLGKVIRGVNAVFLPIEVPSFKLLFSPSSWQWNTNPFAFAFGIPLLFLLFLEFRKHERRWTFLLIELALLNLLVLAQGGAARYFGAPWAFFIYFWVEGYRREEISWNRKTFAFLVGPSFGLLFWALAWNPFSPRFDFSDYPEVATRVNPGNQLFAVQEFAAFDVMAVNDRKVFSVVRNTEMAYPYFRTFPDHHRLEDFCDGHSVPRPNAGDALLFLVDDPSLGVMKNCPGWSETYRTTRRIVTGESYVLYTRDSQPGSR